MENRGDVDCRTILNHGRPENDFESHLERKKIDEMIAFLRSVFQRGSLKKVRFRFSISITRERGRSYLRSYFHRYFREAL